jgi:hypothetical protein
MNGPELKNVINELRLSQGEFAQLVGVSVGAVSQWLSETRSIPGPVDAFVGLFMRLPPTAREAEILQLKKGRPAMRNGMYLIHFAGSAGQGYATLTLVDGVAYGFDEAGALYDGTVTAAPEGNGLAIVDVKVRMPPNVPSVVGGVARPFEWILPVKAKLNLQMDSGHAMVETGLGPTIPAQFTRMRDLPQAMAA